MIANPSRDIVLATDSRTRDRQLTEETLQLPTIHNPLPAVQRSHPNIRVQHPCSNDPQNPCQQKPQALWAHTRGGMFRPNRVDEDDAIRSWREGRPAGCEPAHAGNSEATRWVMNRWGYLQNEPYRDLGTAIRIIFIKLPLNQQPTRDRNLTQRRQHNPHIKYWQERQYHSTVIHQALRTRGIFLQPHPRPLV